MRTIVMGLALAMGISMAGCMQAAPTCEAACDRQQANGCGDTSCVDRCHAGSTTAMRTGCTSQAQGVITCNFDNPCNVSACAGATATLVACGNDYCARNPGDASCVTP